MFSFRSLKARFLEPEGVTKQGGDHLFSGHIHPSLENISQLQHLGTLHLCPLGSTAGQLTCQFPSTVRGQPLDILTIPPPFLFGSHLLFPNSAGVSAIYAVMATVLILFILGFIAGAVSFLSNSVTVSQGRGPLWVGLVWSLITAVPFSNADSGSVGSTNIQCGMNLDC